MLRDTNKSRDEVLEFLLLPIKDFRTLNLDAPKGVITRIIHVGLNVRCAFVGELLRSSRAYLQRTPGLGKGSFDFLETLFRSYGLNLGEFENDNIPVVPDNYPGDKPFLYSSEEKQQITEKYLEETRDAIRRAVVSRNGWTTFLSTTTTVEVDDRNINIKIGHGLLAKHGIAPVFTKNVILPSEAFEEIEKLLVRFYKAAKEEKQENPLAAPNQDGGPE